MQKITRILCFSSIFFSLALQSDGIEAIPPKKGVQSFYKALGAAEVTSHRVPRDIPDDCSNIRNQSLDVTVSAGENFKAVCSCVGEVQWAIGNCSNFIELTTQEYNWENYATEVTIYCMTGTLQNGDLCVQRFMYAEPTGLPIGIQGFLIFICVSVVAISSLFVAKKYKSQISLTCRDSCSPTTDDDGKEFDAYVSIAKTDSDKKFVQRNFLEALQKEYRYKFLVDEDNLLPRLEYSDLVQEKIHRCRRLMIVFTAAYMTNDWCMYCFSEGLRKLLELNIPLIFIFNDVTIVRELNSYQPLVGHVPKLLVSLVQTTTEQAATLRKIRLLLPAARNGNHSITKGMRSPMLSDAEDMDHKSNNESYGGTETKYTFGKTPADHADDIVMDDVIDGNDEMQFDDEINSTDPNSIQVHHYQPRKDFYSITASNM
uniref:uncharacterized protein LOC100184671 isoform X2 n=1 Tax=Ciona intestinalis TaxID=7719 RepID=UPI000EF4D2E4|nr:uncharacterized protein LOC100184671 isoform X2 [Ciona intestinalis]|eukprot:XP_026693295.1 uncharacterized protein LOC100184671 isoform X2 [Ciona intestinalis]